MDNTTINQPLHLTTTVQTKPIVRAGQTNFIFFLVFILNLMITTLVVQESEWFVILSVLNAFPLLWYTQYVVGIDVHYPNLRVTTSSSVRLFTSVTIKEILIHRWYNGGLTLRITTSTRRIPYIYWIDPLRIREVSPMQLQFVPDKAFAQIIAKGNQSSASA
jgi:hypothetical protein